MVHLIKVIGFSSPKSDATFPKQMTQTATTRALLRLERTVDLLCQWREGGREGGRGGREWMEGGRQEGEGGREGGRDDCFTYSNSDTTHPLSFPPQYLNSNHVTYYVITCKSAFDWVYAEQWYVLRPT